MVEPASRIGRPPASAAQGRLELGLARRLGGLVLEVAGDGDRGPGSIPSAGRRSRSCRGLDAEAAHGGEQGADEAAQAAHAPEAAVAHPAVDHGDGEPAAAGLAQQQGPVVPLDEHQGPRLVAAEEAPDGEAEVERQVGHLGPAGEGGPGALLAGGGDGGDQQGELRRQGARQGGGDAHLAHGDGVEPEGAPWAAGAAGRAAQPAGEGGQVMAPPPGEQEGPRREQGDPGRELVESPEDGTHAGAAV